MCRSLSVVLLVLWLCTTVAFFLRSSANEVVKEYDAARNKAASLGPEQEAARYGAMKAAFMRGNSSALVLFTLVNTLAMMLLATSLCLCAVWLRSRGYDVDRAKRRVVRVDPE